MRSRVAGAEIVAGAGVVLAILVIGLGFAGGVLALAASEDSYERVTSAWLLFFGLAVGILIWLFSIIVVLLNGIEMNTRVIAQGDVLVSEEEPEEAE